MIQLTYTSQAAQELTSGDIFKIIETSSRNNLRDELTGFLIYSGDSFFQLIEGPEVSIDALFDRISGDPRHKQVNILSRKQVEERAFPKWRMKRVSPKSVSVGDPIEGLDSAPHYVRRAVAEFLNPNA
ncbi:BLUF domain-containing protein [Erythrobacter sp. MTPC3]|uniref:BLUF domain-containing protein n=1 Tax=Erythrobacter sp. MTPC3 TaxID=3056564 RepID=UPI0036F287C1